VYDYGGRRENTAILKGRTRRGEQVTGDDDF